LPGRGIDVHRNLKKTLLIAGAGLVVWGGWTWWSGPGANSNNKPATLVSVATVQKQDVPLQLQTVGNVVANESVAVRSRLDSQLMEVKFHDGDYVNKGDLLFVLDDRSLNAQLGELKANLERDRAQLANLKLQYERMRQLSGKGYESQAASDNAKAAYEAALGSANASEAAMENIHVQLEYTRITAPISGRTGTINITVGNTVKANDDQSLVTINQIKPIRAQGSLPQRYLDAVRSAMTQGAVEVTAKHEGNPDISHGALEYVDNNVDLATGTFAVRASFPNENEKLWPGMFVNLTLILGNEKQVLTIPEVAIQHGQNGDYVFVIAGDKANNRPVKISRMQDDTAVVESGVTEGEQVATDGLMSLKEGAPVKVQPTETKSQP
jgi:multidrug efflux system membrane fusion protein